MGAMQVMAPIIADMGYGYTTAGFYKIFTPVGIIVSIVLTILAIIGIAEKDQPKYFGIGGEQQEKIKISEYVALIKNNKPLQRLMVAGGGCKLALAVATNGAVLCMLYGCMMGDYGQFYLPMMVVGYVFSAPFFGLTVNTSQKLGQKASLQRYVTVALVAYIGVVILLALWQPNNAAFGLSLYSGELFGEGFAININLYTILFILFFGIGYGAYYSTADMPIPMVADCSDYEMYSSGKYVPGIIGTLFSLVDKLVSSMASLVVTVALMTIGVSDLPDVDSPYVPGMNWVVIALFCLVPMVAWALTLWAMKGYELSGPRMKEIQAINNARKELVAQGMTLEEAMAKIKIVDDIK